MPYLKKRYLKSIERCMENLKQKVYTPVAPLAITCYATAEPVPYAQRTTGRKLTLTEGEAWGANVFDCGWFHFEGEVPSSCAGKEVVLLIDVSGEGLIVDANGEPVQGMTCVDSDYDFSLGRPGKWVYPFMEKGEAGAKVDVWMDAGCNDLFGKMHNEGRIQLARIGVMDRALFDLYYDFAVLVDYLHCSEEKSARTNQILFQLYDAVTTDDYAQMAKTTKALLSCRGGDAPLKLTAIGHAHMDLAWLWPVRETKRKGARTFSTALAMMDRYPDYVFGASQPQLFQWMKEEYPGLYQRIKEKVAEGRIEAQGCMWVEADTNVTGGESLVRQILYGKRFFKEEFGKDVKVLWLPDVFGYSAALPQILKKSGNEVFMTQKLSWSQHNRFPHQTFRWRGIDGTEIFTHMLPEDTYNSPLLPRGVRKAEENYIDSGVCDEALMLFGIGDGGGGPGVEHLESAKRVKDFYGLCPVEQAPAQPMLLRLKEKTWDRLPRWQGELYLERHQGTYTTSARSKRCNRKMENALRELEFLCVLTGTDCPELEAIWKEVLLYQFHDILPGSSIQRVYDESLARYAVLMDKVKALTAERAAMVSGEKTLFNSLSWPRSVIRHEPDGLYRVTVPAMGYTDALGEKITESTVSAAGTTLENRFLKAEFAPDGALISCFDKRTGRESLSAPSNRFALWREQFSDCWDISIGYTDWQPAYFALTEQRFGVEDGEAVCRQRYAYGASVLDVTARLGEDDAYLTFDVHADWQEADLMLRTSFETQVHTDRAGFDIQYGLLHRSNTENTLWDKAQFEVCAHKWVDLSESNWGVALLNESKYGFRVKENVIDMNLLRAQHYPSDLTDRGEHTFSYALYPHGGDVRTGEVKERAYEFNMPVWAGHGAACGERSFLQAQGVLVESLKPAEDGNGVILRAYEPYGTHADMRIDLGREYVVTPCDLLENAIGECFRASVLTGDTTPFDIRTWRLTLA